MLLVNFNNYNIHFGTVGLEKPSLLIVFIFWLVFLFWYLRKIHATLRKLSEDVTNLRIHVIHVNHNLS